MNNEQLIINNEDAPAEPSAFQKWCLDNPKDIPLTVTFSGPGLISYDLLAYGEVVWAGGYEAGYNKRADHAAIEMERARTNWATVKDAAETEHKMAAAEWAARETELKEIVEGGNNACREIANQRDEEQNERMGLAQDLEAAKVRVADLAKSLGELGCYVAGLKTYDEDPSAQRIVKRALGLLRRGAEGQEPGTGYYNASKFEVDGSPIPNPTNAQRYAQWFAEGEALADAALRFPAEEPGTGEEKTAPLVAGEECQRLGHDFVVENYQMVCSRCPNPGAPTKDEGVSGGKGEGVSMKRSDLIKAAEAMGGAITWHGPIIEDLEHDWSNSGADCPTCLRCGIMQDHADSTDIGFCSGYLWQWGVPPEGRTTKTEAEPRTVFESHPGKGNPLADSILASGKNGAAVNGESYNAAAANLRAIMPIAEPIWEGAGAAIDPLWLWDNDLPAIVGGIDIADYLAAAYNRGLEANAPSAATAAPTAAARMCVCGHGENEHYEATKWCAVGSCSCRRLMV